MRIAHLVGAVCATLIAPALVIAQAQYDSSGQYASVAPNLQAEADALFASANRARYIAGAGQLQWDGSLAAAALYHCRWMVLEGPISHRYAGEPDLTARGSNAGAHFAVIEENVALGSTAAVIHDAWMKSPGHRANLLNPVVDRVGIAVIASRGVLYAVEDFARGVPTLSTFEVEARVAELVRASGIGIEDDPAPARAACAAESGLPRNADGVEPRFVMRWRDARLEKLPQMLMDKLASGKYRTATIGSCPEQVGQDGFTAYRVAVLLY